MRRLYLSVALVLTTAGYAYAQLSEPKSSTAPDAVRPIVPSGPGFCTGSPLQGTGCKPQTRVDKKLAQTAGAEIVLRDQPSGSGCPVGISAERRSNAGVVFAGDSRPDAPELGLHITLNHLYEPQIESAEVTVYGVTSGAGYMPADGSSNSGEVSKTFQLHRAEGSEGLQNALLWMHDVGGLTRVEIKSITYADGSRWQESKASTCRAVPNGYLLVGSR